MTSTELQGEIALLRVMSTGELLAKYLEVFGQPSPSRHRERLIRRIAWKVQALAEGDLSERARRRAEQIGCWKSGDVQMMRTALGVEKDRRWKL